MSIIILEMWPESFCKLMMRLETEQPTIYNRVAVFAKAAMEGSAGDTIDFIRGLNKALGTLVLITMPISDSCDKWLAALDKMPAELGSRANPRTIDVASWGPGNDTIN